MLAVGAAKVRDVAVSGCASATTSRRTAVSGRGVAAAGLLPQKALAPLRLQRADYRHNVLKIALVGLPAAYQPRWDGMRTLLTVVLLELEVIQVDVRASIGDCSPRTQQRTLARPADGASYTPATPPGGASAACTLASA
jgi:hypothetical protein